MSSYGMGLACCSFHVVRYILSKTGTVLMGYEDYVKKFDELDALADSGLTDCQHQNFLTAVIAKAKSHLSAYDNTRFSTGETSKAHCEECDLWFNVSFDNEQDTKRVPCYCPNCGDRLDADDFEMDNKEFSDEEDESSQDTSSFGGVIGDNSWREGWDNDE